MSKAEWDKRAQQNRQRRAQNKAKKYNNGKLNRTQRNYVAGDYKASASDRAWGYRNFGTTKEKNFQTSFTGGRSKSNYARMQRGENPYEVKYFYDGKPRTVKGGTRKDGSKYGSFISRKRYLTDEEKKVYEKTGDINVQKYNDMYEYKYDPSNGTEKKFEKQGHVFKNGKFNWDGMRTAKNRVEAGGSKWNYLGGFLKDTVWDTAVRGLQHIDRLGGISNGAIAGVVENATNLIKGEKIDKDRISNNIKDSLKQTDETGWSKGLGDYWEDFHRRNVAKDVKRYYEQLNSLSPSERIPEVEKFYKDRIEELENTITDGKHKAFRSIAGFGAELLNPLDLGGFAVDGTKASVKALKKGLKEGGEVAGLMPKTSQELYEVGLKHKDMLERMKAYQKYLKEEYVPKFGNKIDDEKAWKLFEDSPQAEEYAQNFGYMANNIDQTINHSLDNGFNRAMGKAEEVKEVVKSNPATQNLGRFLDEIGTNVDNGVQRHIDGRKLNVKRTQTKDGYVPQLMRGTDEVTNVIDEVNPNQMSFDNLSRLESKYESIVDNNDIDDVFDYIDELDDVEADNMLDWLKDNRPNIYKEYMGGADTIDDFANSGINMGNIKSKAYDQQIKEITNAKYKGVKPKYDRVKTDSMKEENAIEKLLNIFSDEKKPITYKNNIERKSAFGDYINKFTDDIFNGKVDIEDLSKTVQEVMGKDVPTNVKREFINNKLFEGNNVIASNVGNSSIDGLLESLDDIANLKRVVNEYLQTGEVLPVKLSDATKQFLGLTDDVNIIGSKVRGTKIESPEDLLRILSNSILDRSRALTDERYVEKLQLMAKHFGYEDYNNEILQPIKKLTDELRNLPNTKETLNRRLEISDNLKRLKGIKTDREKMWQQIKNLPENNFDKIMSEKFPQHMKDMKPYSHRAKQGKKLEQMAKGSDNALNDVYNKMFDEKTEKKRSDIFNLIEDKRKEKFETTNRDYNNVGEVNVIDTAKKFVDKHTLQKAIDYKNEMKEVKRMADYHEKVIKFAEERGLKLPERTNAKVKLAKNQTLGSLPPVKNNLDGLKNLVKKEVEEMYTNPELYAKNKTMYDAIKRDYIKGLRSYGVPDNAYFEKLKNLKKSLVDDVLNKKVDKVLDEGYKPTGGSKKGNNNLKMNLQLLAGKVDEMFDELGKTDVDSLSKAVGDAKSVSKTPLDDLVRVKADDSYNPFAKFTENFDAITKEGKEIKLPEDYTVNQATGEVGEIATKKPSKEIQKLMDYVEEEKMFNDFNESIGNDKPSFEKFKEWFKNGSDVPYNDNKVYDLYKRWLNSWKKGLTIYNPGWHVKNFFQNKGQSYLGIGMDAFGSQKNAREMFKNMRGLENSAKGILQKDGTYYSPSELTKIAKRSGVINGFNDLIKESRGLIPSLETAIDNSKLMKKLSMNEETARLHHFLTKIERGATPEEAVKSVNKYLFDYSKQNKADRVISDFVDPFWTYHKNNARLMATQSIENGDKVAKTMRGVRGMQNDVGERDKAKQQYREIQSPVGSFVDNKNKDRYNYQYDMDLFPKLEGAIPMEKDDVMTKLNPLIKLAIQHKDGEGNFGNKVVDKEEANWGEVTKKERLGEMVAEVNPFMNPLFKALEKSNNHQKKADEGKQSQKTSDKQIFMDWLEYILGNKGNYYRDVR